MVGVVVAFPNRENAAKIRNLLVRNGIEVAQICTAGSQVLAVLDDFDDGIVVCGYKLRDMLYSHLREEMAPEFEMLLVASPDKWEGEIESSSGIIGLGMPLRGTDLINTMEMMLHALGDRRKKRRTQAAVRSDTQKELIREAKLLLMMRNRMSEGEAHKYLQKCSMDSGTNLVDAAQMILTMMKD